MTKSTSTPKKTGRPLKDTELALVKKMSQRSGWDTAKHTPSGAILNMLVVHTTIEYHQQGNFTLCLLYTPKGVIPGIAKRNPCDDDAIPTRGCTIALTRAVTNTFEGMVDVCAHSLLLNVSAS